MDRCKGLIYRANVSIYKKNDRIYYKDTITYNIQLHKMRRMSCSGCIHCSGIMDTINKISNINDIEGIQFVKHKALYRMGMVINSTDLETGVADNWHLKLYKYKDTKTHKLKCPRCNKNLRLCKSSLNATFGDSITFICPNEKCTYKLYGKFTGAKLIEKKGI